MPTSLERPGDVLAVVAAGPGLGLAVARRFAREGVSVGLVARSPQTLQDLAEDVRRATRDQGVRVATAVADVADETALRAALRSLAAELGEVTALVYNGSAYVEGSVTTVTTGDLRVALDVGVTGALVAVQEVVPAMRGAGRGTVILTGSVAADRASTSAAAVGMAKAALRSLARSLHKEVAPDGVRATTVTIDGVLAGPKALDLDTIAERYWQLHSQAEPPADVVTFAAEQRFGG